MNECTNVYCICDPCWCKEDYNKPCECTPPPPLLVHPAHSHSLIRHRKSLLNDENIHAERHCHICLSKFQSGHTIYSCVCDEHWDMCQKCFNVKETRQNHPYYREEKDENEDEEEDENENTVVD